MGKVVPGSGQAQYKEHIILAGGSSYAGLIFSFWIC